ncbi:MAG: CHAT domain-containing protein [Candidatus Latescibacteria bacterium]|nr:CHAT domain-containing protein [Candidatus Latescibacterota bacterium]NIO56821.1 CHAT domain-containing protein [Candidatus Latescibacterota bacterium]
MTKHLISSDDSTLARYGRRLGFSGIWEANVKIGRQVRDMWLEDDHRTALILTNYLKRIALVLKYQYNYDSGLKDIIFIEGLSPEIRRELFNLRNNFSLLQKENDLAPVEKLERYSSLLESFEEYGDEFHAAMCKSAKSYIYGRISNIQEQIRYLKLSCAEFAAIGAHRMTSQDLGVLGSIYGEFGNIDSMIICYEESRRIANRSRLPMQAPRITTFYAWHYTHQGRLSLAHDLFNEAMELCRKYKGGCMEIRYINNAMHFQANLGCWGIVDQLLKRARVMEQEFKNSTIAFSDVILLRIKQIEARMKMAQGKVDEAEAVLQRIMESINDLDLPYVYRMEHIKPLFYWAEGLLENGRPSEAINIIRDGFKRSEEASLPLLSAQFALLIARAAYQLQNMQSAEWAIQQFDHLAQKQEIGKMLKREWIERYALLGKLKMMSGDLKGAIRTLEEGLAHLNKTAMDMDAGVHGYIWLNDCKELRQLMHDLTSYDPVLGYGAELFWRDFYRLLGCRTREGSLADPGHIQKTDAYVPAKRDGKPSIIEDFREHAEAAKARILDLGAIHSTYLIRGDEIWRWTVTPQGIRRETLSTTTNEVRTLVKTTWRILSTGSWDSADAAVPLLIEKLRSLAHVLLPPEVLYETNAQSDTPFLITTHGFLSRIPFEAFNIGAEGEYTPLLMHRDVAYLRHADPSGDRPNTNPGVILVNAKPSKELRKRYPFQQELQNALAEGEAVASRNPGAAFLTGAAATKTNLRSSWGNASFIYLAAHTLRDPEAPYLMLIPLAPSDVPSAPDASYLDISDIRATDLSNCNIVVLSGCSSGAPYVEARSVGPSLGDAFLDAGAGAVVQTFWDVRDDEARKLMTSYIQTWGSPGISKIRALCNAKRMALQPPEGARYPFWWASYSIKLGKL